MRYRKYWNTLLACGKCDFQIERCCNWSCVIWKCFEMHLNWNVFENKICISEQICMTERKSMQTADAWIFGIFNENVYRITVEFTFCVAPPIVFFTYLCVYICMCVCMYILTFAILELLANQFMINEPKLVCLCVYVWVSAHHGPWQHKCPLRAQWTFHQRWNCCKFQSTR